MKIPWFLPIVALSFLSGCMVGFQQAGNGPLVVGSGVMATETRHVADFTRIDHSGIGHVVVRQADRESLKVTADDNLLEHLESRVEGGTLHLGVVPGVTIQSSGKLEYVIEVKSLEKIRVTGVGNIVLENVKGNTLGLEVTGVGKISGQGEVDTLSMSLSGTGSIQGEGLVARKATVKSSGVGKAVVHATEELHATLSGVGSIEYLGNPNVTEKVSGIGRVKKR